MKILSKSQIYKADQITLESEQITSTELMERAATEVFNWMHGRLKGAPVFIQIFCGIGNNGGDGLVLARHLINHGYNVKVHVVNCSNERSQDFLINFERLRQVAKTWPDLLKCAADFPEISKDDIIVDAIFGIGLSRKVNDWIKSLFIHFKKSKAFTLSIDVPSGLFLDKIPEDDQAVVWSHFTLSFQTPKLVFFLPETAKYIDRWEVLDIGLNLDFINEVEVDAELIGKNNIILMYKTRDKFSHKGTFGHALIIGGSYGKIGAAQLASKAALVTGAGLVTAYIPKCGYTAIQTALPEIMVITDPDDYILTQINITEQYHSIGVGIGMGTNTVTILAFERFLKTQTSPIVIDADALNMLSQKPKLLTYVPKLSVLTPHPKELERLIGKWTDDFDKLEKTKKFSKKHEVIIVIKGFNTITVFNQHLYINTTGNPGLATAGSGDVLTGMITGLMAQGYSSLEASVSGVYLHGKSADILAQNIAYQSITASHVIDGISNAYLDLFIESQDFDAPPSENNSYN